jgi:hypothetical protein
VAAEKIVTKILILFGETDNKKFKMRRGLRGGAPALLEDWPKNINRLCPHNGLLTQKEHALCIIIGVFSVTN